MKLFTKIYLAIGFILLIFSFVTFTYLRQEAEIEADIKKLLHSEQMLRQSQAMQKSQLDMETGIRGYLLSENETFLEPYNSGLKNIIRQSDEILKMADDSTELQLLQANRREGYIWVTQFAEVVIKAKREAIKNPEKKNHFDSLYLHVIKAGVGKRLIDRLRGRFAAFDAHQNTIRETQLNALNETLAYTRFISITLTITAIIISLLTTYFLLRLVRRRLFAMIDLADHIAQGDFNVKITELGNDEISRLGRALNRMASKLKTYFNNITKANRELDQFAYVVSHDLKAPLRAINNLAEWIAEDITDQNPEIQKNLQLMRGRVHRMENLINGILAYSKVDRKVVETETFDSKKLLEEVIDLLAPPPNFEIILPEKAPVLTTEKIFLQQVFSNLISNAIKYNNKPKGIITIQVRKLPDYFEFSVTDNGPGVPEQFHQKIFGIFQTMEARDTKESTGVGLAIVKKIIDEKGGQIKVESKENEYTSFIFTWPKQQQPVVV